MEECTSDYQIYRGSMIPVYALVLLSTIPILYKFIRDYQKSSSEKNTHVFYAGTAFIVFNMLFYASMILSIATDCTDQSEVMVAIKFYLWVVSYIGQTYLLLQLGYLRLILVFKSTIFELSKCAVFTYRTLFISIPSLLVIGILLNVALGSFGELFMIMAIFILIITLIAIFITFIRKTITVFRKFDADDTSLIEMITKLMILNIISLSLTFLTPLVFIIFLSIFESGVESEDRVTVSILFSLCTLVDAYSNLWCVILAYSGFKNYYDKMCGSLHMKCNSCCNICVAADVNMLKKTIEIQTNSNSTSGNSSLPTTAATTSTNNTVTESTCDITTTTTTIAVTKSASSISE